MQPRRPLYTVKEVRNELREIDKIIREVRALPVQSGADNVYASFAGRLAELQQERAKWEARLELAEAYEDWLDGKPYRGPGQGPKMRLE